MGPNTEQFRQQQMNSPEVNFPFQGSSTSGSGGGGVGGGDSSSSSSKQNTKDGSFCFSVPHDVTKEQQEDPNVVLLPQLPNNVSTMEQVEALPDEFKSVEKNRNKPLRHVDESTGEVFDYALNPIRYAVVFVLIVELFERFSYYGIVYTETSFLTGIYDYEWSPEFTAIEASSFVSISTAIAYTTPFLGAIVADTLVGEYYVILFGAMLFYIPAIVVLSLTTIPHVFGSTNFPYSALRIALLLLWPIGTGAVKSVVNVFGAKQFHPVLQSSLIEIYYVTFYMCINIGSMVGGVMVPVVAQHNITIAYMIPMVMLGTGLLCFLLGTPRYCISKPHGDFFSQRKGKLGRLYYSQKSSTIDTLSLWSTFTVCSFIIPFNIVYNQMPTTFIVQGTVMKKAFGFLDAATMNNLDAVAVLLAGYGIGHQFYPWLARRGIKLTTGQKFTIGSVLGALACGWALIVEWKIHSTYEQYQQSISILWQTPSYVLIGAGEIFAISTAYETAFMTSPRKKKAFASAINIFCVGGLPNVICLGLYKSCSTWFETSDGTSNIQTIDKYSEASVAKYFALLMGIAMGGAILNLLPHVSQYVTQLETEASEALRKSASSLASTPRMTPRPTQRPYHTKQQPSFDFAMDNNDESERDVRDSTPLIRAKKYVKNLKHYGVGSRQQKPILYKALSLHAPPPSPPRKEQQ